MEITRSLQSLKDQFPSKSHREARSPRRGVCDYKEGETSINCFPQKLDAGRKERDVLLFYFFTDFLDMPKMMTGLS